MRISSVMSSNSYNKLVLRTKQFIKCSECDESLLPRFYERHLKQKHNYTEKQRCIWCLEYTWKKRDTSVNNFAHRVQCLQKRLNKQEKKPMIEASDLYLNCKECDAWLRDVECEKELHLSSMITKHSRHFAKPIQIANKWREFSVPNNIEFSSECGIDPYWIQLYETLGDKYVFLHLFVRYWIWDEVYEYLTTQRGWICVMPNWCLCFGKTNATCEYYHRHQIVIVKRNHLSNLNAQLRSISRSYEKVTSSEKKEMTPYRKYKISSLKHFFNVYKYVSSKTFKCLDSDVTEIQLKDDGFIDNTTLYTMRESNHFFISHPIIPHALIHMAGLSPSGLQPVIEVIGKISVYDKAQRNSKTKKWICDVTHVVDIKNHLLALPNDAKVVEQKQFNMAGTYHLGNQKEFSIVRGNMDLIPLSRQDRNQWHLNNGFTLMNSAAGAFQHLNKTQTAILDELEKQRIVYMDMLREKDNELREQRLENKRLYNLLIEMKK